MSNLKWTITYCRLFVWTLFQHPGNLISSADFTSFEFFLEFWPIFSCFATKYFALYMKMSKKFQKSADFLEFCRQCPRIFCPLLGTVRYWELLLNKNGREAEFCPLLGAFPLLGSALLGALSVFVIETELRVSNIAVICKKKRWTILEDELLWNLKFREKAWHWHVRHRYSIWIANLSRS